MLKMIRVYNIIFCLITMCLLTLRVEAQTNILNGEDFTVTQNGITSYVAFDISDQFYPDPRPSNYHLISQFADITLDFNHDNSTLLSWKGKSSFL